MRLFKKLKLAITMFLYINCSFGLNFESAYNYNYSKELCSNSAITNLEIPNYAIKDKYLTKENLILVIQKNNSLSNSKLRPVKKTKLLTISPNFNPDTTGGINSDYLIKGIQNSDITFKLNSKSALKINQNNVNFCHSY